MRKYLSAICLWWLVGCAVGPDYQRPDLTSQLPARFQQVKSDTGAKLENKSRPLKDLPIADHWWQTFNDTAINQLVEIALSRNLDLTAANANIQQARAQVSIIDSSLFPQLSATGRVGRDRFSKNSEIFANLPIPNPEVNFTDYRAALDASWELDLFGHTRRQVEAASARLNSIEHQREAVALRVTAEVVHNIIDYRAWQRRSKNAEAMLEANRQLLDLSVLQKEAGLFSESDVIDAETAMHQAAAVIPTLQSAATVSLMALTVLTDQTQENVIALLEAGSAIPAAPDQLDTLGLPSDLLRRRPDLRIAERELAAATADIGVAVAEQYPRITLIASGGLDAVTPGKFHQLASRYWNVGPQISIPLFAGGRLTAQVKSSEAARDAALAQYRQAVLTAFADTETALIRYQREQQRLQQIKLAFDAQHRQLELAEARYKVGETNFAKVLQTRLQLAQIHDQQLASQQAVGENVTALYKSLGGDLTTDN